MPRHQTVLFDLDGTIIDSVRLILDSYHHTLRIHGRPAVTDADWLRGVGTPLRAQLAPFCRDEAEMEAMIATYREYNLLHHDASVTPYHGVVEVIRAVRASGIRLALVTSKNRHGSLRGLTVAGLAEAFDLLVCADDVVHPKPHPEPVLKALAHFGADPRATVFVGDSVHDMQSGRSAGVETAAVLWGPFGRADLEAEAPDYWLETPDDLARLLVPVAPA